MSARINYAIYPFVATEREFPNLFIEKPSLVVVSDSNLRDLALSIIKGIIEKGEVSVLQHIHPEEAILVYYAIVDIVKSIDDAKLASRVALAYSKTASQHMRSESGPSLVLLANKLGINAKYETKDHPVLLVVKRGGSRPSFETINYQYSMPISQYLRIVATRLMHDPLYSLSNFFLKGGTIYLDRDVFQRILEEHIYHYIIRQISGSEPPRDESFLSLVDNVLNILKSHYEKLAPKTPREFKEAEEEPLSTIVEELFPPCIKKTVDSIRASGNPSHAERFNLAAFLGQLGLGVDEVLEYFKLTPDYNEKIARYQVEHILGLRGSKKKYMPYNCDRLKSMGICPVSYQCEGGKNPLAVYKYNLRLHFKRQREVRGRSEEAAGGI